MHTKLSRILKEGRKKEGRKKEEERKRKRKMASFYAIFYPSSVDL